MVTSTAPLHLRLSKTIEEDIQRMSEPKDREKDYGMLSLGYEMATANTTP